MKKILFITFFISCLLLTSQAFADPQVALSFVKARQEAIVRANQYQIGLEIDKTLDYDRLIKDSMGLNWRFASPDQQLDIVCYLKKIIRKSLEKRLKETKSRKVKWVSSQETSPGYSIIKSLIEPKEKSSEEPLEIEYLVFKDVSGIRVIDVIFDGVSTKETYKRQFDRVIKKEGINSLISKLAEKSVGLEIDEDDGC